MVDGICAPLSPARSHQRRSSILFCPTTSLLQGLLGIGTGECLWAEGTVCHPEEKL